MSENSSNYIQSEHSKQQEAKAFELDENLSLKSRDSSNSSLSDSSLGHTSRESSLTDSRASSPQMDKSIKEPKLLSDEELKKAGIDPHYAKYDILEVESSPFLPLRKSVKAVAESIRDSNKARVQAAKEEEVRKLVPAALKAIAEGEKKEPDSLSVKKQKTSTKGIKGKYAGLGIEEIRAKIRTAIDPHTYQTTDSGEIKKVHYGHRDSGKSR